jgi:hypothetical protein
LKVWFEMELTRRGARLLMLMVIAGLIVGGVLIDKDNKANVEQKFAATGNAISQNAHSRIWYCLGGSSRPSSVSDSNIVIANRGDKTRNVKLTIYGNQSQKSAPPAIKIPAFSVIPIHMGDYLTADFVGAVVSADGEGLAADLVVRGSNGIAVTPCSTRLGGDWYFSDGSTQREGDAVEDNKTILSIMNPSTDVASVDVTAVALASDTEPTNPKAVQNQDQRVPKEWHNMQVEPRSLLTIDIGSVVERRVAMAIKVHSEPGRIVAAELISRVGSTRKGITVTSGGTLSKNWYFSYGLSGTNATERINTYFPGSQHLTSAAFMLPYYPKSASVTGIDAIERDLSADQADFFNVTIDGRTPRDVEHSWNIETNDPMVVERSVDVAGQRDVGEDIGLSKPARVWIIPYVDSHSFTNNIAVTNFGTSATKIKVRVLSGGKLHSFAFASGYTLKAGLRTSLNDVQTTPNSALIVTAEDPVIVEQTIGARAGAGFDIIPAIPIG